jgi:predicted ArsR family transcriptional regulator
MTDAQPELPYVRGSATSRDAALSILGSAAQSRLRVYNWLRQQCEGATDEEIAEALSMNPSSARPRRVELVAAGIVEDSGFRRRTHSGRKATVWSARG